MEQSEGRGREAQEESRDNTGESVPENTVGLVELMDDFMCEVAIGVKVWIAVSLSIAVLMAVLARKLGELESNG